jgi:anti-sigma B factor antagonist
MTLEVERKGDVLVVSPHGRLGEMESQQLERELVGLIDQGARKMVFNFADVPFITSTCLGVLMLAHKRVRPDGGFIRIAASQPLVRQILEITKLTRLFGLYDGVDEAVRGPSS